MLFPVFKCQVGRPEWRLACIGKCGLHKISSKALLHHQLDREIQRMFIILPSFLPNTQTLANHYTSSPVLRIEAALRNLVLVEGRISEGGSYILLGSSKRPQSDAQECRHEAGDYKNCEEDDKCGRESRSGHADETRNSGVLTSSWKHHSRGAAVPIIVQRESKVAGRHDTDHPVNADLFLGIG